MKNKKGEITTQQIVLLVILIVSFVVILFLLFRLDFSKESEKDICHNSIVMKGTKLPDAAIPIKCSRSYICLTSDGTCERMTSPKIMKVKGKEEIFSILAAEMADCWWMFGEGRINYVDPTWKKKNYCSICTQFLLDDSVKDLNGVGEKINQDEFYDYLVKTNMPDSEETYASYIFGTNELGRLKRGMSEQAGTEVTFGEIKISTPYFIVMGITSEKNDFTWYLGGALVGGILAIGVVATGGLAALPITMVVAVGEAGGAVVGGEAVSRVSDLLSPKIGAIVIPGDGIDNEFMAPTIQEATSYEFRSLNCDEIITEI